MNPFDALKYLMGGAAGAAVMLGWAVMLYGPSQYDAGQEAERAAARARAMELIEKRANDDAEINLFDMADLCRELGGEWVREQNRCD